MQRGRSKFSKFKAKAIIRNIKKNISSEFLSNKKNSKLNIKNFILSLKFLNFKNKKYREPIRNFKKVLFKS
jgi:uncharacterized protein YllA (UPF0747 family)